MRDVNRSVDRRKIDYKPKIDRDPFNMALDQFQKRLVQAKPPGRVLGVGIILSHYFSREMFTIGEGLVAWPALETIAKETNLPLRTVQRCVRHLQKRGLVRIVEGGGKQRGNQGRSHRYIAISDSAETAIPRQNRSRYHDRADIRPLNRPLSKRLSKEGSKEDRRLEDSSLAGFDDFETYPGRRRCNSKLEADDGDC
jgi:hypothetical protein